MNKREKPIAFCFLLRNSIAYWKSMVVAKMLKEEEAPAGSFKTKKKENDLQVYGDFELQLKQK